MDHVDEKESTLLMFFTEEISKLQKYLFTYGNVISEEDKKYIEKGIICNREISNIIRKKIENRMALVDQERYFPYPDANQMPIIDDIRLAATNLQAPTNPPLEGGRGLAYFEIKIPVSFIPHDPKNPYPCLHQPGQPARPMVPPVAGVGGAPAVPAIDEIPGLKPIDDRATQGTGLKYLIKLQMILEFNKFIHFAQTYMEKCKTDPDLKGDQSPDIFPQYIFPPIFNDIGPPAHNGRPNKQRSYNPCGYNTNLNMGILGGPAIPFKCWVPYVNHNDHHINDGTVSYIQDAYSQNYILGPPAPGLGAGVDCNCPSCATAVAAHGLLVPPPPLRWPHSESGPWRAGLPAPIEVLENGLHCGPVIVKDAPELQRATGMQHTISYNANINVPQHVGTSQPPLPPPPLPGGGGAAGPFGIIPPGLAAHIAAIYPNLNGNIHPQNFNGNCTPATEFADPAVGGLATPIKVGGVDHPIVSANYHPLVNCRYKYILQYFRMCDPSGDNHCWAPENGETADAVPVMDEVTNEIIYVIGNTFLKCFRFPGMDYTIDKDPIKIWWDFTENAIFNVRCKGDYKKNIIYLHYLFKTKRIRRKLAKTIGNVKIDSGIDDKATSLIHKLQQVLMAFTRPIQIGIHKTWSDKDLDSEKNNYLDNIKKNISELKRHTDVFNMSIINRH